MVKKSFEQMGVSVMRNKRRERLEGTYDEIDQLFTFVLGENGSGRKSQWGQDVFALIANDWKRDGFFVEFGAADGKFLSNTHLLETSFGWTGILAEPAKAWHPQLRQNRKANIETDCVWRKTGEVLSFDAFPDGEFSAISGFGDSEMTQCGRSDGMENYDVNTISLNDLLRKYDAPGTIDYISIDTEGSELDIIQAFDFSEYSFNAVTVEHNYSRHRDDVRAIFEANGYRRAFQHVSKIEDWYLPK
ncbi:MAG: FkbM family methyltransferase [Sulfitobacter sp.]